MTRIYYHWFPSLRRLVKVVGHNTVADMLKSHKAADPKTATALVAWLRLYYQRMRSRTDRQAIAAWACAQHPELVGEILAEYIWSSSS